MPSRRTRQPRALVDLIDEVLRRAASDLTEDEAVHDLRVACRRLEAGARINRDLLSGKRRRRLRDTAKAIRRAFDQARDLEVIAAEIAGIPCLSPAFREGVRTVARSEAAATAAQVSIGDAVATLRRLRDRLQALPPLDRESYAAALAPDIVAFFDELFRLLPESTDEALHEVRISAKKLRYEMEVGRPAFPRLAAQVKRMKRLQDVLGRHQDAVVGLRWAETLADGEMGATPEDRATLMRYYAALRRGQRRQLRRLLAAWRERDMRARFLAAVRFGRASAKQRDAEDGVRDAQREADAGQDHTPYGAVVVGRL